MAVFTSSLLKDIITAGHSNKTAQFVEITSEWCQNFELKKFQLSFFQYEQKNRIKQIP